MGNLYTHFKNGKRKSTSKRWHKQNEHRLKTMPLQKRYGLFAWRHNGIIEEEYQQKTPTVGTEDVF